MSKSARLEVRVEPLHMQWFEDAAKRAHLDLPAWVRQTLSKEALRSDMEDQPVRAAMDGTGEEKA